MKTTRHLYSLSQTFFCPFLGGQDSDSRVAKPLFASPVSYTPCFFCDPSAILPAFFATRHLYSLLFSRPVTYTPCLNPVSNCAVSYSPCHPSPILPAFCLDPSAILPALTLSYPQAWVRLRPATGACWPPWVGVRIPS